MPASMRRASHGAIGLMPCGAPASMIVSQSSSPRAGSVRKTSYPISPVQPVRLTTTGMPEMAASRVQ